MTVPKLRMSAQPARRPAFCNHANLENRLHRAEEGRSAKTQLQLLQFEDRSVPSATPFHAVTSETFANSLLTSSAAIRNELVVIDPTVPGYQALIRDLQFSSSSNRHFEFVVLSAGRDGLDQVTAILAQRQNVDAVHFVTHGVGGAIRLGNTWVNQQALRGRADQVTSWSKALTPGADFLFYGCDLAGTASGRQWLQSMRALTGADVAASTDRTGASILGGDWDLEYRAGDVETSIAFSPTLQKSYGGTLAMFVVTSVNNSGAGTLRDAITQANALAGTDTISFGFTGSIPQRIQLTSALPTITGRVIIDATTMSGYAGTPLIELDGTNAGAGVHGLSINSTSTIRGLAIFGFAGNGILVNSTGANGTIIQANHIGIDGVGTASAGNGLFGITVNNSANVVIGGSLASQRNVISANIGGGIVLQGASTTGASIQGNWIGLQADGVSKLGNVGHGILLQTNSSNNIIGGTLTGMGNEIAYSGGDGIRALGAGASANQFLGNSIHDNAGLGIDLNGDGPSPNDVGDGDSGPNALKNFPVLTVVLTNGSQVSISGTYNSTSSNNYRIELFANPSVDPSGYGEGARYLGFVTVTTDGSGNATFSTTITALVAAGEYVSGIATDLSTNNTSEFSLSMKAVMPQIVVAPTKGLFTTEAGGSTTFSVVLNAPPTANVVVPISVNNSAEGKVVITNLTFTSLNWNKAQTVNVTGVDDLVADGDQAYAVIVGAATSKDGFFNGVDGADVDIVNTDNEVAAFIVTPTSGLVTTEASGQAFFTVSLTSQPIADVTISVAVSNAAEGFVNTSMLTFTSANWNVPQTVIVTGVDDLIDDGDQAYTIILGPASSPGTPYAGVDPPDVVVANVDDDTAGFLVTPNSGLITTETGGQASFSVRLTSQPLGNVTVNVASSNPAEGTPSVTALTFTSANWNVDQTVTITGVDEFVADGNQNYSIILSPAISGDSNYSGLDPSDVSATNKDNDSAGVVVTPLTGLVTTEAGGQAKFSVVLTSQPLADVVISITANRPDEGTVDVSSMTFTPGNWNVPQFMTVTGLDDFVMDGSVSNVILLNPATSADPIYNGMDAADVSVVNLDDDVAGYVITPIKGLVTTEAGGKATFTIRLTSQPVGDVTINIASSNLGEGSVSVSSLVFTAADWKIDQTVMVTGVDDYVVDGDISYSIVLSPAISSDTNYSGFDPTDVAVTNTDNDSAGIIVTPTTGLVTTEAGGQSSFTVRLTSQPVSNVTINIASSNPAEGFSSVTLLTFTPANWSADQTVTINGVDDVNNDGDIAYAIILSPATSLDTNYSGFDPVDVSVTNIDDEMAGVIVTPILGLVTTEAGGQAQFAVRLAIQPVADVTISIATSNPAEGTISVKSLTFTSVNWNIDQIVTITGVDDAIDDGDTGYAIILSPVTSADADFNGLDPADVSVTNIDNDFAGIFVTPTIGLVTTEAGGTSQFTVRLTSQPLSNVTINVASSNVGEGLISVASLTFTVANWNIDQMVIITGVDDLLADGVANYSIILSPALSTDASYNGLDSADVSVTNVDNDSAGIVVTPTNGLVTTEAGGQALFSIRLTSQPIGNVTINIASSNPSEGNPSVASLMFTPANWNIDQYVTVIGVDDFVDDGDGAYAIVVSPATSTDANYDGVDATDVSVINTDNDAAGIIINPTTSLLTTEVGGISKLSVRLSSQPVGIVTINLMSSNTAEGVTSASSLTFTAANWNINQFVTITGADDFIDDGNISYTVIFDPAMSTDANYDGLDPADVAVTNVDNDKAGILVTPTTSLVTTESGGTFLFSVRLTSQPAADVILTLQSSNVGEGIPNVTTLVFSADNWAIEQFVVVTGINDLIDDGDQSYAINCVAATSADVLFDGIGMSDVALTNLDDDVSGFVIIGGPALSVDETGTSTYVNIVLTSQPIAPVTFRLASATTTEVDLIVTAVTFDSTNWSVPQRVEFRGVADGVEDGNVAVNITLGSVSFDPSYDQRAGLIIVTNNNVHVSFSNTSLATAVKPGVSVPVSVEEEVGRDERALATSSEIMVKPSSVNGLSLSSSSGSSELQDSDSDGKHDRITNGASEMIPVNRPGLSPTGTQLLRRPFCIIPADATVAAALPTIRFEPMRESMGKMDRDLQQANDYRTATVQVTVGTAAVASAGYILWSLRGAAWVASAVASSLPAWSAFDPLVLLTRKRSDDDEVEDSLLDLIDTAQTV